MTRAASSVVEIRKQRMSGMRINSMGKECAIESCGTVDKFRAVCVAVAAEFLPLALALVHLKVEGESPPTRDHLRGNFLTTDGVLAFASEHAVQHRNTDDSLGLLCLKSPRPQSRADDRFIGTHACFNQGALAIISVFLPSQPALCIDHVKMAITLTWQTRLSTRNGGLARWDKHRNIVTILRDCLISGRAIIGAIGHHFVDFFVDLIQ
jgi:hypothetical protein